MKRKKKKRHEGRESLDGWMEKEEEVETDELDLEGRREERATDEAHRDREYDKKEEEENEERERERQRDQDGVYVSMCKYQVFGMDFRDLLLV